MIGRYPGLLIALSATLAFSHSAPAEEPLAPATIVVFNSSIPESVELA